MSYQVRIWNETTGEELELFGALAVRLVFDDAMDGAREFVAMMNQEHRAGSAHVREECGGEEQRYRGEIWQDGMRCCVVR